VAKQARCGVADADADAGCRLASGAMSASDGCAARAETLWARAEAARVQGRFGEASAAYRRTSALVPDFMAAHANLALVLEAQAETQAAASEIRRAIHLAPDHPQLPFNLGNLLYAARRPGAAAQFRRSLALKPDQAGAWLNLGVALHRDGALSEAASAAGRTLALEPAYAEAWNNLGNARRDQGRIEDALESYEEALRLKPFYADAARNRLGARLYLDDDEERAGREASNFARRFGPPATTTPAIDTEPGRYRDPERPLTLGLLTSDLGDHPVGRNLAGLIEHRDPRQIRLAVYDTGGGKDALGMRFRERVDLWRSVAGFPDPEIASLIRADRIDVLLSLAGRFDRNRPLVAAWRAAPVQVAMYDGGASGMGSGKADENADPPIAGWLTDRWLHPEGTHAGGDRLLRLPLCYSFQPLGQPPPPRHADGDRLVLGSFSNPAKLSRATLEAWKAILRRLPEADLALKYRGFYADPEVKMRILGLIGEEQGSRLRLIAAIEDTPMHLERYGTIDIALDPFPFSGATTSFEALSMGVPVVTLAGNAAIGRTTAAILGPLGLEELIASSAEEYVERVVALAKDRARRERLRREIPERLSVSPLLDGKAHAASLAEMFRRLWRERVTVAGGGVSVADSPSRERSEETR
jgi:predicted O-linked N-acetylglucosamine transferase (SPINDLY family)